MIKLYTHPDYHKKAKQWTAWRDLYEGDHEVLRGVEYLWMHELEDEQRSLGKDGSKLRAIREQRSRYLNLMEPIVSRWLSFIFRRAVIIPESIKAILGDEIKDINGQGIGLDTFIREIVGKHYILYGRPIIQVDTSAAYARTLAEAKVVGSRPFMNIIHPLELQDWQLSDSTGRVGAFDFTRTEYKILEPRQTSRQEPTIRTYSREMILSQGTYQSIIYRAKSEDKQGKDREWEVLSELSLPGFEKLPISWINGESYVKDSAEMQLLTYNYMSAESTQLNSQAFQRIFISGALDEASKPLIGEYLFNFLAQDSVIQTIEPSNTEPIRSAIETSIDRCFKVSFNEINGLASDSKESPGSETRKEMKDEFIALVQTSISEVEDLVNQALEQYLRFKDKTFSEGIKLDKNITEDDITQEIAIWQAHIDSFKQVSRLYKGVLKKHSAVFGLPDQEEIDKEIEALPSNATEQAQDTKANLLTQVLGDNGDAGTQPKQA